jgi:hypothetical protein
MTYEWKQRFQQGVLLIKRAGFAAACSLHACFTDVSGKRFAIEWREKLVVKSASYIRAVIRSMELTTCDSSKPSQEKSEYDG